MKTMRILFRSLAPLSKNHTANSVPPFYLNIAKRTAKTTLCLTSAGLLSFSAYAADITQAQVLGYANAMTAAANAKDVDAVASLVTDDAIISITRNGKKATLDKPGYLTLLQNSWSDSNQYRYQIKINNIVTTGDQAKANVVTNEVYNKSGSQVTFVTNSRTTFVLQGDKVKLLRAVSQVSIN